MAYIHGMAGEWARVKGTVVGLWPLFVGLFAAGFALALCIFASLEWGFSLLAAATATIGFSLNRGLKRTASFFIGAKGEERVSSLLKELPDTYHIFNDFVAGRVHVDHVVVGPAGVFALETKFWRGRVTVEDGHILVDGRLPSRPPLIQARHEARRVQETLADLGWQGRVTPVLVFASDTFDAHIDEIDGVVVINSMELRPCFSVEQIVIPQAEQDRLVSLMENNA